MGSPVPAVSGGGRDRQVERAYGRGYRHFISGMAQGGDLLFCEAVLRLKQAHPEVVLEAAIPCQSQADRWNPRQQERYRRLLAQCDLETLIQKDYTPDCMQRRNCSTMAGPLQPVDRPL